MVEDEVVGRGEIPLVFEKVSVEILVILVVIAFSVVSRRVLVGPGRMAFYTIALADRSAGCPTTEVCVKVGNPGIYGEEEFRRLDAEVFVVGNIVRVLGSAFHDPRKRKRCVNVRAAVVTELAALGTFATGAEATSDALGRIKHQALRFEMTNSNGAEGSSTETTDGATVAASVAAACKFFLNEGSCRFGDRCLFAHPAARHVVQPAWVQFR